MLPAGRRLRHASEFSEVVRNGRRAGGRLFVIHHLPGGDPVAGTGASKVGFVVSKAVGNSVVRHRVSRRLRAQMAARADVLPASSATVVRALPPSADADSAALGRELDRLLARIGGEPRVGGQAVRRSGSRSARGEAGR